MRNEQLPLAAKVKHKAAFALMHLIMVSVPLIAGFDKYFNFITDWERYVSPALKPFLPVSSKTVMRCAGVVEIAVGAATIIKPRAGSVAFSMLMLGIVANLLTMKKQAHIASLDTCLGCFALIFALLMPDAEKT